MLKILDIQYYTRTRVLLESNIELDVITFIDPFEYPSYMLYVLFV